MPGKPKETPTHRRLAVRPIGPETAVVDMLEGCFWAHNARSLRDASSLFTDMLNRHDCVVGLALGGALVPAGLGESAIIPLMKAHLVDWMVATGANLYHDLHAQLGFDMLTGDSTKDDEDLKRDGLVRIHNLVFRQEALYETDRFLRGFFAELHAARGDTPMSTAEMSRLLGEKLLSRTPEAGSRSILAAAAEESIPVFCPAVADSSIGMNLAALALAGCGLTVDPMADVNESAAIVYASKKSGSKTGVLILGGGVAKNFMLQTEPHIQEVLGLEEYGHDFFIQFTDARVDTGGLSGATPSEAVTWGKIDLRALTRAVVCYCDCTIAFPVFASFALKETAARESRRLAERISDFKELLRRDHMEAKENKKPQQGRAPGWPA